MKSIRPLFMPLAIATLLATANTACQQNFPAKNAERQNEMRTGSVSITTTVGNRVELPECTASSQNLNAYLAVADRFVKCSGASWRDVVPTQSMAHFEQRAAVRYHEWEDGVTKKRWSVPSDKEMAANEGGKQCARGWKLPSRRELTEASANGLSEGLRSRGGRFFANAWTDDFEMVDGSSARVSLSLDTYVASPTNATAGVYCIGYGSNS